MVIVPRGNNAGSVLLVGALVADEAGAIRSLVPKNMNFLDSGLLKVIRPDNWRIKAAIAQGNFTV